MINVIIQDPEDADVADFFYNAWLKSDPVTAIQNLHQFRIAVVEDIPSLLDPADGHIGVEDEDGRPDFGSGHLQA